MKKLTTRQIALNGIVAGLYAAITILTASFAYGNIQFRISEALMMLLLFEPHLTIGLTIGCLIANLFSTVSVLDIVIGTAATLLACLLTTRIKKPWLAPLPTILVNAVMVGAIWRVFSFFMGQGSSKRVFFAPIIIMRNRRKNKNIPAEFGGPGT